MKDETFRLVLFTTDAEQVATMRARFRGSDNISVELGTGLAVTAKYPLDAMWLTPMQASYFGITDVVPSHQAGVFPISAEKAAQGFPELAVVGVNLDPNDSKDPLFLTRLCTNALIEAVRDYNRAHRNRISSIGSTPENLCLIKNSPSVAFQAVQDVFRLNQLDGPTHLHVMKQIA